MTLLRLDLDITNEAARKLTLFCGCAYNHLMSNICDSIGLRQLLGSCTLERFLDRFWPDGYLHSPCATDALNALKDAPWVQDLDFLANSYRGEATIWMPTNKRAHLKTFKMSDALAFYESGATLYLTFAEQYIHDLRTINRNIERDLGLKPGQSRCELFLSRAASGTPAHFDHDLNLNVQLKGRKKWKVAKNEILPYPMWHYKPIDGPPKGELLDYLPKGLPNEVPEPSESFETAPGSLVFLPQGYWHSTVALDDSVAISFVIIPPTWLDLFLKVVRKQLLSDPRWRQRVFSNLLDKKAPEIDSLLSDLHERIRGTDRHALEAAMNEKGRDESYMLGAVSDLSVQKDLETGRFSLSYTDCDSEARQAALPTDLVPFVRWLSWQTSSFTIEKALLNGGIMNEDHLRMLLGVFVQSGILEKVDDASP